MVYWSLAKYDNGVVYQEWCKQRIVSGIWSNIQSSLILDNNLVKLSKRALMDGENYHNLLINRVRESTKIMVSPANERRYLAEVKVLVDVGEEYFFLPKCNLQVDALVNSLNGKVNTIVKENTSSGVYTQWLVDIISGSIETLHDSFYMEVD